MLMTKDEMSFYEVLPIAFCIYGLSGTGCEPALVSDGLCALLGSTRKELLADLEENCFEWIHPDDRETVSHMTQEISAGSRTEFQLVLRMRKKNREWITACCEGKSRKAGSGELLLFVQFVKLQGKQSQSGAYGDGEEKQYRQELEQLSSLGNNGLVSKGHMNLSADQVVEYHTWKENADPIISGMTYDEAIGTFLNQPFLLPEHARIADAFDRKELIRKCINGENRFTVDYCCQGKSQLPLWLSTRIHTFLDPQTGDVECYSYTYDITDKTLEDQVFSRLPMLGFDVVGMLYVQTHACRYFRIKKMRPGALYEHVEDYDTSIGGDIEKIVLPNQREAVRQGLRIETIQQHLETEETYPFAYSMVNRQGDVLQKLLQFSYLDSTKSTIFFCKSDITRQTEGEHRQIAELENARMAADRANEAKSAFLSSMSHDLRTPLNGILRFTDFAMQAQNAEQKQEYLKKIRSSGDLLLALVNDTLELSRIESGKYVLEPEDTEGEELALPVVTAVQPLAQEKQICLETELSCFNGETFRVDRLKFQKIILNLLSNAVKYTPAGGTVRISAEKLQDHTADKRYRIVVQDTGIGIHADFLNQIFEPFSQEKRPEAAGIAGTGLGLSIVKRIVTLMHGEITVQSEPGKGSVFTVVLPLRSETAAAVRSKPEKAVPLTGMHVLLCEDNYLNTEIAVLLLKEKEIRVDCAKNGKEGVELFRASAEGTYQAVLMDVRMPILNGRDATREIRAMKRADSCVPIIAMTADVFEEDIRKCLESGMNACISKPINPEDLYSALRKYGTPQ